MREYAAKTHPGLVRQRNEDCFTADAELGLWLVADGIGGHSSGEVASTIVGKAVREQLLAGVDLVVGSDTGPIHIAAAVGTSTVSIFRVTDPKRNAPRGSMHSHASAAMDCSPCLLKRCSLDQECGLSISVDKVYDMIVSQIKNV